MIEWLNAHQKQILYGILIFFLVLVAFYLYFVRPLQIEEVSQQQQLQQLQTNISHYETQLKTLTMPTLTSLQKKALLDRVPIRANVEQVIADLEKTELETGVVINNVSFSVYPNEAEDQQWKHILSEDLYEMLEEQVSDVETLSVSYLELNVSLNGEESDVHTFVEEIEKLKRIIHIQSYDYSVDQENNRINGTVTLRAFYSEDFAEFIEETSNFKLDYNFDPNKLNRYIEVVPEVSNGQESNSGTNSESSNTGNNNGLTSSTANDVSSVEQTQRYFQPTTSRASENERSAGFYVVQTGGYNTEASLYEQITKLRNAGVYPREIERDQHENDSNHTKFIIYSAIAHDRTSAEQLANYLSAMNPDFTSWVDYISLQDSSLEQAAHDILTSVSHVVTTGITQTDHALSAEEMLLITAKIRVYELKVKEEINKSNDGNEKAKLEATFMQMKQIENTLNSYQNQTNRSLLWQVQGALIDVVLTLNGYVSFNEK